MENPKSPGSFFARLTARHYFIGAVLCFGVDMFIAIVTQGYIPATRVEAVLRGLVLGGLGWLSVLLLLAGIARGLYAWKNDHRPENSENDQDNLGR
jgi:hypothetical protein